MNLRSQVNQNSAEAHRRWDQIQRIVTELPRRKDRNVLPDIEAMLLLLKIGLPPLPDIPADPVQRLVFARGEDRAASILWSARITSELLNAVNWTAETLASLREMAPQFFDSLFLVYCDSLANMTNDQHVADSRAVQRLIELNDSIQSLMGFEIGVPDETTHYLLSLRWKQPKHFRKEMPVDRTPEVIGQIKKSTTRLKRTFELASPDLLFKVTGSLHNPKEFIAELDRLLHRIEELSGATTKLPNIPGATLIDPTRFRTCRGRPPDERTRTITIDAAETFEKVTGRKPKRVSAPSSDSFQAFLANLFETLEIGRDADWSVREYQMSRQ